MSRRLDGFSWIGTLCVLFSGLLAARLVWEQTALSVESGPQMVGFSLMHSGIGLVLWLGPIVGIVWAIATGITLAIKRERPDRIRVGLFSAFVLSVVLLLVPYGIWQRLLVSAHAHGAHAGEFISYASATGDLATVKALIDEGVPVNARNEHDGSTALHGAAVEGRIAVIRYLLSKGADVNALNAYGDSPLHEAITMNKADAIALLREHGGKEIIGSDEQRAKAVHDEVARDINSMNRQN